MSNFRRRLMMSVNKSKLPSGYTELEYLESTGTQYIDTNILSNNDSGCEMCFQFTNIRNVQFAIGSLELGISRFLPLFVDTQPKRAFYYTNTIDLQRKFYANEVDTDIHFVKYNCDGSGSIIFDDINCGDVEEMGNSINATIYLFARNYRGADCLARVKMYKCIIYEKGRKISNFIPALDASSKPCMYDTVSKQTFYNKGKGEFLYG